jgi:hypothetical protein
MAFSSVRANRGTRIEARSPVPRNVARRSLVVEARAPRAGVGIMGTKAGMTTIFQEDGTAVACTVIGFESSNYVTGVMTKEANGYDAVQVCCLLRHIVTEVMQLCASSLEGLAEYTSTSSSCRGCRNLGGRRLDGDVRDLSCLGQLNST